MAEIADDIAALRRVMCHFDDPLRYAYSWDDDITALRRLLSRVEGMQRVVEERRGFETWCEGAAITLKRAADILCDLGTEEADDVYAQAYTALNLCPVEIPTPAAGERDGF